VAGLKKATVLALELEAGQLLKAVEADRPELPGEQKMIPAGERILA
jgi:hypothetical protein